MLLTRERLFDNKKSDSKMRINFDISQCDIDHTPQVRAQISATRGNRDHRTKIRRRKTAAARRIMAKPYQLQDFKFHSTSSFLLLITYIIVTLISSTAQGSHNQQYIDSRNNNAIQSILLDTTEQSSLGWTKYPDGERAASRSPGWVEESFVNFERDINWRSFVVCDVAFNSVNNWLWTPFIERGEASRLYIEIKFTMRDCNLFPQMVLSCKETFALLYKEVDGPIGSAQPAIGGSGSQSNASFAQSDSYTLIDAIAADEGRFTSNNDVVINTEIRSIPVNKRGVYFAFRDQGACLSLISIKVYHLRCPQQVVNFARFNSTPTGRDLTSLVAVEGECVANSVQIEQPRMFCSADGQWNSMSSGQCKCLAGHEPASNASRCLACPPGKFKWQLGDSHCQTCPERSYAPAAGSSECKCHEGFYRAARDPRWLACTQPPSSGPSNLSASYVDSSLVVLQWQAPKFTGGREDLVYRLVCDSCGEQQVVSSPPVAGNFSETRCVLAGLQPGQSYRFLVYALNGVSAVASSALHPAAYSEITVQTLARPVSSLDARQQQQQQQQLPVYNFRAIPGARGTDMILAWDNFGTSLGGADQLAAPLSLADEQGSSSIVYEVKYQAARDPFGSPLSRRSPYALMSGEQQQQLQQLQNQFGGSLSTTNKALGLYALQPRTEYSFQIRAKLNGLVWTDWSEPVLASTGAPTASSAYGAAFGSGGLPEPPASLAPASQFLDNLLGGDPRAFLLQPPSSSVATTNQRQLAAAAPGGPMGGLVVVALSLVAAVALVALALVRYRKSLCLRSLAAPFAGAGAAFQPHSNGSSSSTYASSVYAPGSGAPADLLGGQNPFGSTITTTANGNHLIYHNAAIAQQQQQQQQHYGLFNQLGSAGALITGANSATGGARASSTASRPAGVVQSFLASTLGHLTGAAHHHHQAAGSKQHQHTIGQDGKLFIHSAASMAQQPGGDQQRNHYHQMLGNVNHTLLFGQQQQQHANGGAPLHFTTLNQQQLVGGGQQQDFYSIRQQQQQQQQQRHTPSQQYGALEAALANGGQQQHIYDDLDVVSQSANSSMQSASPPHLHKQQLAGQAAEQRQQQQSALSMMMARELYDAQQQQAISLGNVIGGRGEMDPEAGGSYQHGGSGDPQTLPGGSKIKELQNDVNQITNVMQSNINKVLERGDRIDTLNERSELLTSRANEFRINSRNIRRKFWWQNFRFQVIIGLVIAAIVFIIIYSIAR